jgi:hypothetical protein
LSPWIKYEEYEVKDGILRVVGNLHKFQRYFPVPSQTLVNELAAVHDQKTLLQFVKSFGPIGCGEPALPTGDPKPLESQLGDSVELCMVHAQTIRAIRDLIAALHQAERGGAAETTRLAAEIFDVEQLHLSLGDGRVGNLIVGARNHRVFGRLQNSPFSAAHWILQSTINANTEGIRPFLYFGTGLRTCTWLLFTRLYELAYWQLGQNTADDRLRKCRRAACGTIFEAKRRKQVYCNRRCLDRDKRALYAERKRGER